MTSNFFVNFYSTNFNENICVKENKNRIEINEKKFKFSFLNTFKITKFKIFI